MITTFVALASAAEVGDLLAAQHVVLELPERPSMVPERPEWREGWLLVLRVAPELAVLGQGPQRDLWVGDQPVSRFVAAPGGPPGCLVVVVEGPVDLATTPVFFGPPGLAERVTPTVAAERVKTAVAAGAVPFPTDRIAAVTLPEARLPHGGALPALASARRAACTP